MLSDIAAEQAQVALDQPPSTAASLVRTDSISKANYDHARFTLEADQGKLESPQQARVTGAPMATRRSRSPSTHTSASQGPGR
jgi:hypothetical protein